MSELPELARKYRKGCKVDRGIRADDLVSMFDGQDLHVEGLAAAIEGATTLDAPIPGRMVFLERFTEADVAAVSGADASAVLFILPIEFPPPRLQPHLRTETPRADYSRIIERLFEYQNYYMQSEARAPGARIASSAILMPGVVVGRNSSIGARTVVHSNVVIGPNCTIGEDCIIKSGTVIGQPGFGVFRDREGLPQHFPHVGGVVIENHVEIGAINTVCSGSIHPTVIGEYCKFDDHVHVAHNCVIGRRTLLTAAAELSGSVIVGDDCWVGPNSSVIDGARIGARAFIGIGANVTKSVDPGTTVAGNPARPLPPRDK
jgi:UDP-3-O-[3-hydroxymyristoyl] glucosamine N-acyltransferase